MSSKTIIKFLFFYLIYFSSQLSLAQERNTVLDDYLSEYIKIKNVPSISAGLLQDGRIVWQRTTGFSDLESNIETNKHSVYRIASISKSITAVAILQLWEKGLIGLDKDVRSYLPDFPEKKWKFTIRQLLNHTSGIRNYKEGEFDSKKFYSSIDEAIKVFEYDSLNFEPGTKYEYTSLDYMLIAAIIEKVTKTSFDDYLKNNVFLPAEMKLTRIDNQREIIPNRVRGYEKNAERKFINAPLADLSNKVAGGGLLSTVEDLLQFSNALLENRLLKRSTMEMMTRKTKLKNGKEIDYGLGFSLEYESDTLKYISHMGAGTGFSSMLIINPKLKNASVTLINIRDRNLNIPAKEILEFISSGIITAPSKTLSDDLMKTYLASGIDSSIQRFKDIYRNEQPFFTLNEKEGIYFANDLIESNKISDAITYLKEFIKFYPQSFQILVAIADAYLKDKNEGVALRYYRNAAQLNKNDVRVNNLIKKLSNK
jgi:serine beta-lactamase-like protein LACTB, mitochondrial